MQTNVASSLLKDENQSIGSLDMATSRNTEQMDKVFWYVSPPNILNGHFYVSVYILVHQKAAEFLVDVTLDEARLFLPDSSIYAKLTIPYPTQLIIPTETKAKKHISQNVQQTTVEPRTF